MDKTQRIQMRASHRQKWVQRNNCIATAQQDLLQVNLRITGNNNIIKIGRCRNGSGHITIPVHDDGNKITHGEGVAKADKLQIVDGITPVHFASERDIRICCGEHTGIEVDALNSD